MYPRSNYEMSEADLAALLDAMKPVAAMMIGGTLPSSQQENANNAWAALGKQMSFDPMTVQPQSGKGQRFFSAVPSENATQRSERIARETEASRVAKIAQITTEILERKALLAELTTPDPTGLKTASGAAGGVTAPGQLMGDV